MRRCAIWTSVATILALNMMVTLLVKDRQWAAASVFAAVVVGMLVILGLRLASIHLSDGVHLATDVVALNIYLIAVPWYRSTMAARDSA